MRSGVPPSTGVGLTSLPLLRLSVPLLLLLSRLSHESLCCCGCSAAGREGQWQEGNGVPMGDTSYKQQQQQQQQQC